MIAIAHFTMGVAGGAFLLTYFPKLVKKYIGNLIKKRYILFVCFRDICYAPRHKRNLWPCVGMGNT